MNVSVEGELRNVHVALEGLGEKVDKAKDDTVEKIGEVKEDVAQLAREVTQVGTDGVRTRDEFEKHVDGHEVVEGRKWGALTAVAAGVILIVAGIVIRSLAALI